LKNGTTADIPIYDYRQHLRDRRTDTVRPHPAILVEGILVLADDSLRRLLDVTVYVDTDDTTRRERRLRRDVTERGRTPESVAWQFDTLVRPMHAAFVEPSRLVADVVIEHGGFNRPAIDRLVTLIEGRLAASRRAD
jgi:uridine kinase